MSNFKRRKVYIDRNVQGALARRIILHWVVFLIVASLMAFLLQCLSNPFRPLADQLDDMWFTQGPFLVVMLFLLPVFVMDTIKVSHRFAGPIFNLRRAIQEIAAGKPPRKIKFRSNDFWQDLSEDFNAMLTRIGVLDGETPESEVCHDREDNADETVGSIRK